MAVFLMENGVLSMGNKTPVTILQETLQKRGMNPHYELIHNGVGMLDPVFKFRVSAAGFTAIGDGKSKKEAKHDAAAGLLKRMQQGSSRAVTEHSEVQATEPIAEDIASPYTGALKGNYVGMLDETCVNNKIPLPVYIPISEAGPAHAKIFTIQCRVSSCTETAVARTKKQAKHLVAQQMMTRLAAILGDRFIPLAEKSIDLDEEVMPAPNLRAIESGSFHHDMSVPFDDLQDVFYLKQEEFLVPQEFLDLPLKPEEFYDQLENPKEFLENLLKGLEGTCKVIPTSMKELETALEEIEKDCEKCWWAEEDSSEDEKVEIESLEDDSEFLSNFENIVLEEFNLKSDDNNSSFENPSDVKILTADFSQDENANSKTFAQSIVCENIEPIVNGDSTARKCSLFLNVECPQGLWTFRGCGESETEAERKVAVEALKFLRMMAVPSSKKVE